MSQSGNVGTLTDGFDLTYSISDAITVTETLDGKQIRQYKAVLGQQESYSIRGDDWLQTENRQHTFKITASDGQTTLEKSFIFYQKSDELIRDKGRAVCRGRYYFGLSAQS